MFKKFIFPLIIGVVLISGCSLGQQPQKNTNNPMINTNNIANTNAENTNEVNTNEITEGPIIDENYNGLIPNPSLELPSDINSGQIEQYFQFNGIKYALVMRSSMNIVLTLPRDFTPTFSGVLKAGSADTKWTKMLEIKDVAATDKNNPYYLWIEKDVLKLSVVDQNGAGSGEGRMKVYDLISDNNWRLTGCYYYPSDDNAPTEDNYFSYTKSLGSFKKFPITECQNVRITIF